MKIRREDLSIPELEYKVRLKEFLKENGPNPGTDFYSRWSWAASQEQTFRQRLFEAEAKKDEKT